MKKILIPTDFSKCANFAKEYAFTLASKLNCELEFLHIISTPIDWLKIPLLKEKLYPEVLEKIRNAKNELSKIKEEANDLNIKVNHSMIFNIDRENITENISISEYELIIIGSHGSSGLEEKLIGSNAQTVIRNSEVPVLVIKSEPSEKLKNAVFVSEFQVESKEVFQNLLNIADKLSLEIELLFVNTPNSFFETIEIHSKMDAFLASIYNINTFPKNIINAGSIEEGIKDYSQLKKTDVICIGTHGKSGLKQLFSPSITEAVANHLDIPVLSIKL